MTWVVLPGMDGTGGLLAPFAALCPEGDVCVVVRYPRTRALREVEFLKLIDEFLPSFGDYILVAESFSGQFAVKIAARKPQRLRGIVLVATFARCPVSWLAKPVLFAVADVAMRFTPPRRFVRRWLLGTDATDNQVEAVRAAISSVKGGVLASRLRMVLRCDVRDLLADVNLPTVVIGGTSDRLVARERVEELGRIPGAEVVWIDAPHLVLFCNPSDVWTAIADHVGWKV